MKDLSRIFIFSVLLSLFIACQPEVDKPVEQSDADKVDAIINGKGGIATPNGQLIVLDTRAFLGQQEKTVGMGLPLRYIINYDKNKPDEIGITINKFTYGKMPLEVDFRANAKLSYEATAPKNRKDWLHFYSNKCYTGTFVIDPNNAEFENEINGNSVIDGYLNPNTGEIEFLIVYNMMGVKTMTSVQKIDLSRIHRYEEEMLEYIKKHNSGG